MRVLLVEDDPTTQQSVTIMLESASMVVDATDLGDEREIVIDAHLAVERRALRQVSDAVADAQRLTDDVEAVH